MLHMLPLRLLSGKSTTFGVLCVGIFSLGDKGVGRCCDALLRQCNNKAGGQCYVSRWAYVRQCYNNQKSPKEK